MVNLGNDEIVKYPFLAEAGKYLSDKGFSLEQFGTDPDLKKIVENAFERIITASEGRIFKSDFSSNNSALPLEIFSFLIAVILLKLSGMNTLIRRFSLAEARRAEHVLEVDPLRGQPVDVGRLDVGVAVAAQITEAHVVHVDDDYVRRSGPCSGRGVFLGGAAGTK